jgi:bifunctional DNA-binding transcriptional regulator/antitoxin component of YhaV-PrlF toxin-antitoxin module
LSANKVAVQRTNTGQLIITIPRAIADMKGWKKGTLLEYIEDRYGDLTLKEAKE